MKDLDPRRVARSGQKARSTARRLADRFHRSLSIRWEAFRGRAQEPWGSARPLPEIRVEDLQRILLAVPGCGLLYRTLIETAATTKRLRVSELVALRWKDIDWVASTVSVNRAAHGGLLALPKFGTSRTVRLAPHTRRSLRGFRASLEEPQPDDLVFASPNGNGPLSAERARRLFRSAGDRAGLLDLTLQSLHRGFKAPWWSRYL